MKWLGAYQSVMCWLFSLDCTTRWISFTSPQAQIVGKTSIELGLWVHPEQRQQILEATRYSTGPITMEVQFCASNGQIHDGTLSAQKVELEGEAYLLSTFLDTTERKKSFCPDPECCSIPDAALSNKWGGQAWTSARIASGLCP